MPDLFDEVAEDLRTERLHNLWRRYGVWFIAAIILVVAATGGWQAWRWQQRRVQQAAAISFLSAAREATPGVVGSVPPAQRAKALATFEHVIANGPSGYRLLARFRAAALLAESGKMEAADQQWNAIAADQGVTPLMRDLAVLMWAEHQPATAPIKPIRDRLAVIASPGNPWRALVEEQIAMLDLRAGDTKAARDELGRLSGDINAPPGVRQRAAAILGRLTE